MDARVTSTTGCDSRSVKMPTISTKEYLLDQAKRRFTPSITNFPGMSMVEKRLLNHDWPQHALAEPPAGSALKPAKGDAGLPILAHTLYTLPLHPRHIPFPSTPPPPRPSP